MKLYCPKCQSVFEDPSLELCPDDGAKLFMVQKTPDDPLLGVTIDSRFRIESLLGRGGMGAVYKGTQLSVGRQVAIKIMHSELLDRESALERFWRESKIISELSHPNIVRLYEFGQDRERDLLYLVMELVNGINLGDTLERGRLRAALALEIVYQVCGALTEPHAQGVIHRDLKPDNLLLVPISDGTIQAKVLDFGIARVLEGGDQKITATGMVCGTPQYMAPEQAQNQEIGPYTDLYALGVILYEMLCGIPPFTGQNSLQLMLQQIQIAPPSLTSRLPPGALPEGIESLVHDMLAKTPSARPQSAREVRDRIDKIRRQYNMDLVRLDPDRPQDSILEPWLLPLIPVGQDAAGRPKTGMLRRETGLERAYDDGSTHSTGEELAFVPTLEANVAHTTPLPEAERIKIRFEDQPTLARSATPKERLATGKDPSAAKLVSDQEIAQSKTSPYSPNHPKTPSPTTSLPFASRPEELAPPPASKKGLLLVMATVLVGIIIAGGVAVALMLNKPPKPDPSTQLVQELPQEDPPKLTPEPTTKPVEPTPNPTPEQPTVTDVAPPTSPEVKPTPPVTEEPKPATSPQPERSTKPPRVVATTKPEPKPEPPKEKPEPKPATTPEKPVDPPKEQPATKPEPPKEKPATKPTDGPKDGKMNLFDPKAKKVEDAQKFFEN